MAPVGVATVSAAAPTTVQAYTLNLAGTPATNDIWSVTIGTTTVSVTIGSTVNAVVVDTLAEIADALAAAIRGTPACPTTRPPTKGASLLVVKQTAGTFTPTLAVTPAGSFGRGDRGRRVSWST